MFNNINISLMFSQILLENFCRNNSVKIENVFIQSNYNLNIEIFHLINTKYVIVFDTFIIVP